MAGHVVASFHRMEVEVAAFGNVSVKEGLHVCSDIRIGIFVDRERGRGVLDEYVQQACADLLQFGQLGRDLAGHDMEAAGLGGEEDFFLEEGHGSVFWKSKVVIPTSNIQNFLFSHGFGSHAVITFTFSIMSL